MGKAYYQPNDNYERNLLMVKRFGGKFTVFLLPFFMLVSIALSCYVTVYLEEEPLEYYLLQVANSKLGVNFELSTINTIFSFLSMLLSVFLIYAILYIFFVSKNQSMSSNPDFGYSLLHMVSKIELLISALMALFLVVNTAVFIFGDVSRYESLGEKINLSLVQLEAYKVTISIVLFFIDVVACLFIWYAQTQADFLKSIRLSLVESLPKNKGAHIYGVLSVGIGVITICFAGVCTFLYYCYRDAFAGFGISIEKNYVYMSLALSYVNGFIPVLFGVNAFVYSAMVDETITYGNLYNRYTTIGIAEDPNMSGRFTRKL